MKMMRMALPLLTAAVLLTGCTVTVHSNGININTCAYSEDRTATIPLDGAAKLRLDAGAGDLRVASVAGLTEVRVQGRACASSASLLDRLQIRTGRSADTIRVETEIPSVAGGSAYIDLTVEVPETMVATICDDSGDMRVTGLAGADITDESGNIDLRDIAGKVTVDDQSGEITMDGVKGVIHVRDQSGEIRISGAGADVVIDNDESGNITITDVDGSVVVDWDQSGDIEVRSIRGDFTVRHDGAGEIRHSGVGGRVDIPRKH